MKVSTPSALTADDSGLSCIPDLYYVLDQYTFHPDVMMLRPIPCPNCALWDTSRERWDDASPFTVVGLNGKYPGVQVRVKCNNCATCAASAAAAAIAATASSSAESIK